MMVGSDPEGGPRREVGAKEEVVAGGGPWVRWGMEYVQPWREGKAEWGWGCHPTSWKVPAALPSRAWSPQMAVSPFSQGPPPLGPHHTLGVGATSAHPPHPTSLPINPVGVSAASMPPPGFHIWPSAFLDPILGALWGQLSLMDQVSDLEIIL